MKNELIENFPNTYRVTTEFKIGDGWMPLLWEISSKLEAEILRMDQFSRPDYYVNSVIEKEGILEIDVNYATDKIFKLIDEAESISEEICEFCGKLGRLRNGYVSCEAHINRGN